MNQKPSCLWCSTVIVIVKSGQVPETDLLTQNALLEIYFSTSCHKESDNGSDCSQDNYIAVLKGHFQPCNNQKSMSF